jgi:hypothetical protein
MKVDASVDHESYANLNHIVGVASRRNNTVKAKARRTGWEMTEQNDPAAETCQCFQAASSGI